MLKKKIRCTLFLICGVVSLTANVDGAKAQTPPNPIQLNGTMLDGLVNAMNATQNPMSLSLDTEWSERRTALQNSERLAKKTSIYWSVGTIKSVVQFSNNTSSIVLKGTSGEVVAYTATTARDGNLAMFAANNIGAVCILQLKNVDGLYEDAEQGFKQNLYISFDVLQMGRMDEFLLRLITMSQPLPGFLSGEVATPIWPTPVTAAP